jgi:F-type H+-transporting ATPase subunit gamma
MSGSLADLRRKIDSAQQLQGVVRTMKAMAASSIGQYEAAVRALADYERSIDLGLSACLREGDAVRDPRRANPHQIGAIVFGSDQGLVGRFNEVVADFAIRTLAAMPGEKKVWAVGERVCAHLSDAGVSLAGQFAVPRSVTAITPLIGEVQSAYESHGSAGDYPQVHVFHNRPRCAALYEPVTQRLLPLDAQWRQQLTQIPWPTKTLPQVIGARELALRALVHEYLFISLFKACAESLESENGSRLAAMQRAEKNIESISAVLNQSFYRLRQGSIDEELFDVIAGFNALSAK